MGSSLGMRLLYCARGKDAFAVCDATLLKTPYAAQYTLFDQEVLVGVFKLVSGLATNGKRLSL